MRPRTAGLLLAVAAAAAFALPGVRAAAPRHVQPPLPAPA